VYIHPQEAPYKLILTHCPNCREPCNRCGEPAIVEAAMVRIEGTALFCGSCVNRMITSGDWERFLRGYATFA